MKGELQRNDVPSTVGGSRALRWLCGLSLVAALACPLVAFACLFPMVENIPAWDQWSQIEVWTAHFEHRPVLPLLLKPYNGHLNFLPRLFFYGLGLLSHWDIRLEVAASYLIACGTLTLLLLLCRRSPAGMLVAAAAATQAFSFLQFENFLSGYAFGQNLSQFLSTLVIYLLTLPNHRNRALAGAAAASAASTFSWGAGLAAWYVGLVALLLRRDRKGWQLGGWLTLTLLVTAAVRRGAGGAFGPIAWGQIAQFFLGLLGKAWTPVAFPSLRLTIYLGAGGLLLFGALAAWTVYRRLWQSMLPWILLGVSTLASAGLIALGRTGAGMNQALASHYVTATYPLVLACTVLLVTIFKSAAEHSKVKAGWWALVIAAAFAPVLQAGAVSYRALPVLQSWLAIKAQNTRELVRGTATDTAIRTSHHPDPALVRSGVAVLKRNQLSWFHGVASEGPPSGTVDRLAGQTLANGPVVIEVDKPWTAAGWAVGSRRRGGAVKAVYLLIDGRRIASAQVDLPRRDVADHFGSSRYLNSGWLITVPASAVHQGDHLLQIAVADFNDGLFILLETELTARTTSASNGEGEASSRLAGDHHKLGAESRQEPSLATEHKGGQRR